jgi:hypothetical protein
VDHCSGRAGGGTVPTVRGGHREDKEHIHKAHTEDMGGGELCSLASRWGVVECMSSRYWRADVSLSLYVWCLCVTVQWVVCARLVPRVRLCGEWGASAQQ